MFDQSSGFLSYSFWITQSESVANYYVSSASALTVTALDQSGSCRSCLWWFAECMGADVQNRRYKVSSAPTICSLGGTLARYVQENFVNANAIPPNVCTMKIYLLQIAYVCVRLELGIRYGIDTMFGTSSESTMY